MIISFWNAKSILIYSKPWRSQEDKTCNENGHGMRHAQTLIPYRSSGVA
jgi:hypothetical protein